MVTVDEISMSFICSTVIQYLQLSYFMSVGCELKCGIWRDRQSAMGDNLNQINQVKSKNNFVKTTDFDYITMSRGGSRI